MPEKFLIKIFILQCRNTWIICCSSFFFINIKFSLPFGDGENFKNTQNKFYKISKLNTFCLQYVRYFKNVRSLNKFELKVSSE